MIEPTNEELLDRWEEASRAYWRADILELDMRYAVERTARSAVLARMTPGWRPISEAIAAAKADHGFIAPCLFGVQQSWGWETWVGQCDCGEYWLGRSGDGEFWETDVPTHFMPLPTPPSSPEIPPATEKHDA